MSDKDIRTVKDHPALEAWVSERDQDVTLLTNAAKRLDELVLGFGAEEFWQRDITEAHDRGHLSLPATAWARTASPAMAPLLAGWLRGVAGIAAESIRRGDGDVYVDQNALSLATHVLGAAR